MCFYQHVKVVSWIRFSKMIKQLDDDPLSKEKAVIYKL